MSLLSNVFATVVQGQQVVASQLEAGDAAISGDIGLSGNLLQYPGPVSLASNPAAALAYTVPDGVVNIIANNGANNVTLTLPTPSLNKGRTLIIKNLSTTNTVISASSNVVPINLAVSLANAGTAILAAAAAGPPVVPTKSLLVCDGTYWIQML